MARPKGTKNKPKGTTKRKPKSNGLGDTIKKFTNAIGIEPCKACSRRARFLNKAFPYNTSKGEMTQEQYSQWKEFKEANKKIVSDEDMNLIEDTYNAIYHTSLIPCRNCGGAGWLQLVKGIDKVYNSYE